MHPKWFLKSVHDLVNPSLSTHLIPVHSFSFTDLNRQLEAEASAAFTVNVSAVLREEVDIIPTIVDKNLSFMTRAGDNQMPIDLLALIEKDDTLSTSQFSKPRFAMVPGQNPPKP